MCLPEPLCYPPGAVVNNRRMGSMARRGEVGKHPKFLTPVDYQFTGSSLILTWLGKPEPCEPGAE